MQEGGIKIKIRIKIKRGTQKYETHPAVGNCLPAVFVSSSPHVNQA
jgi:hypothetical protein